MLAATLLALAAAVLHAGWNLAIKQRGDRFLALWGQFFMAGLLCSVALVAFGGLARQAWPWVVLSGSVHLPYCWFLARAYDHGDFSLVYPVARGGGALLAAIGGIALLGDELSLLGVIAVTVVAAGLFLLAGRARGPEMVSAAVVAGAIGVYSVSDAKGIRVANDGAYVFGSFLATMVSTTTFGLVTGRREAMAAALRSSWRRFTVVGAASAVTYAMVQLAFERAPVGYVTALRESSVVIAAFAGARLLHEPAGARRIAAAATVVAGLVLLVLTR